jgi:hypothetical protein
MNLRAWLRKSPAPVKVQCGRNVISVPDSRTKWADVEETLEATAEHGDKIQALDASGALLRAFVWEDADGDDAAPSSRAPKASESELVLLARELNNASDNGARRHEAAYALAFDRLTGLCQTIADRLTAMETMWSKSMLAQARAQADSIVAAAQAQQAGGDSDVMKILGPMLGPMMTAAVAPSPAKTPPPNGKAT